MKIISWNVNGLRSVYKKGFLNWFKKTDADIVCLQEAKIQEDTFPSELQNIDNYFCYKNFAKIKGYSGVIIYTRNKAKTINCKFGMKRFDDEGRYLELDFDKFIIVNLYLPHGGRKKENLDYKLDSYQKLFSELTKYRSKNIIITGDFNIAHTELDLARPKSNQNNIMFTTKEREQIDKIEALGFVDTFRQFNKGNGHYTWWPWLANCRNRNIGWRIDYTFIGKPMLPKLKNSFILNEVMGSDHCPVGIEI
jgi:exodeoxyribonuclease-3